MDPAQRCNAFRYGRRVVACYVLGTEAEALPETLQATSLHWEFGRLKADVAQLVEHSLGKGEVISSILIIGSRDCVCIRAWL